MEVRKQFESQQLKLKSKFKPTERSKSILLQRPTIVTEDLVPESVKRDVDVQLPSSQYMGVGPRDYTFLNTNRSVF